MKLFKVNYIENNIDQHYLTVGEDTDTEDTIMEREFDEEDTDNYDFFRVKEITEVDGHSITIN